MTIISNKLRFLGKEFLDRSLIQQRSTQNSQHFVGTSVQFEVMLNDSHQAICCDGRVYLDPDSSLCRSPKGLDFEMLLNPFKEEFYTPTIFIKESNLCGRYLHIVGQVKAAVKVNGEKLLFNWQMGRDLVQKKAEERWGAGVVEQVSLDLRREFPQEDGFSARNLHYMKQWYLYYTTEASKLQRPVAELKEEKLQRPIGELVKQPVSETENYPNDEFPLPFALVPWGQHIEIITRSESLEEALFYMQHVIEKGLSRTALVSYY